MNNSIDALLQRLADVGVPVGRLSDLVNTRHSYRAAVPVLLDWLNSLNPADMREFSGSAEMAVRALAVREARGVAAPSLIRLFRVADEATGDGLRWTIGNTLEVLADESVADELIALALDPKYGASRRMVVLGLGRLRLESAELALIDLLQDEEVVGQAVMALGRLRSKRAVPALTSLLDHPTPWIRTEARKALARVRDGT